ncbi:MAG: nucleoside hydrolase [Myxococcota bacterium]
MADHPRPILFDTDIGSDVDDALALGLILAVPDKLSLLAVTTVAGDTALRARVAASLLGLAGRTDVEVCIGETRPLLRSTKRFGAFGHEADCVADTSRAAKVSDEPAPERIVRAARETDGLEIVLVGPMTNLARALALDPKLPTRVSGITIMGGHIREVRIGGFLCSPGIDHNLCSDPEATVAVLGAGFRTTLVTSDVTLATWLSRSSLAELRGAGPVACELARQVDIWEPVQRKIFTRLGGRVDPDNAAFLHDPLTVLALIDASSLEFEPLHIVTAIEAGVLRTREVDPSLSIGASMRVATGVDALTASSQIAAYLIGGA